MRELPADGTPLPQGHIRVALEMAGEMLCIAVEDDGIGLPEGEERERLTEPYVTHKTKGTGLGLAIVKKIMEDHGGRIELRDAPGGQGARAELYLPVRAAAPVETALMERNHGA
jgi:two-component system nitrogen regulation sensor histidine kinase NtrY